MNVTIWLMRRRIGLWLERQPWAREFVLREDPSSAEFVEYPVRVMLRVRYVNRVSGEVVVRDRPVQSWKRDGYLVAAWIGFLLGVIAMFVVGSLFGLAGA